MVPLTKSLAAGALSLGVLVLLWDGTPVAPTKRPPVELTGATWVPARDRYLVVDKASAVGRPRLFTMRRGGGIDETAVPIEGTEALEDPTSICAGPLGTFFVTASHSFDQRGERPPRRRQLLHLAASGGALRVIGRLDLTRARGSDERPLTAVAKLRNEASLDVEALAYREGALYIGLKAPLAEDGSAVILRMPDAVTAIDSGTVLTAGIEVWMRARLCRNGDRASCTGISDMTFMGDGRLLLLGAAPADASSDVGGSLWLSTSPEREPVALHHFEGMAPEGIALAPDGFSALIVFVSYGLRPTWVKWPLPR